MIDIEKLNRKHFLETDMYYRIELGLASRLLKCENGIFHLEIIINRKWDRNYNAAAAEMAYCWRNCNEELKHTLGCKAYIIDTIKHPYKQLLLNSEITPDYDGRKGVLFYKSHLN
jgi:hypothetical protein